MGDFWHGNEQQGSENYAKLEDLFPKPTLGFWGV